MNLKQRHFQILHPKEKSDIAQKSAKSWVAGKNEKSILNGTLTQEADQGNYSDMGKKKAARDCQRVRKV
jgi:hypothetical protein